MNLSLLPGRILIVKDPPETMSSRGIHYPDVEHVHAWTATVLLHEPSDLWIHDEVFSLPRGQRIIAYKHSGKILEIHGTCLHVIREQDVLGILTEGTL